MKSIDRVMAVIDPTTDRQLALTRAMRIAEMSGASVHCLLCVSGEADTPDREAFERVEVHRGELWLDSLIAPYQREGIEVTREVRFEPNWRDVMGVAAEAMNADLVVKSSFRHLTGQRLMKTSDWQLLRSAPCPVLLVKRSDRTESGRILAALNIAADDEAHQALNEEIIETAKMALAARSDLELHAVNAYRGSDNFVHPPDLARKVGIDRSHAHAIDGAPETVIPECAQAIRAELVIIGTVARRGVSGLVLGNTAERVLDKLDADVFVIVAGRNRTSSKAA